MPAGENKQDSREQVNRSLQIYLLYACSEKNTASKVWFQDRFSAKVNQHNVHWHKWKDLNSSSPGLYLLRSVTEAHAWWGTKPDPSAGYSCWRTPLDVSCIGLFFISPLLTFSQEQKISFLAQTQGGRRSNSYPFKISQNRAVVEHTISEQKFANDLEIFGRGHGTDWAQYSPSVGHLHV